ncbi:AAA family ATPase [Rhodococcus opacus]|nr:AAA family ATPase [Rhodococcus opacus]
MGSEEAFHAAHAATQRVTGRTLNAGQEAVARHFVFSGTLLSAGIGPAGTGKTTAMKVVTAAWKAGGANVHALASSHVAAKVLEAEIDATGHTIDRILTLHQHGHDTGIRPGDLVLVDEAGMASRHNLDRIVAVTHDQGAGVRLLDPSSERACSRRCTSLGAGRRATGAVGLGFGRVQQSCGPGFGTLGAWRISNGRSRGRPGTCRCWRPNSPPAACTSRTRCWRCSSTATPPRSPRSPASVSATPN